MQGFHENRDGRRSGWAHLADLVRVQRARRVRERPVTDHPDQDWTRGLSADLAKSDGRRHAAPFGLRGEARYGRRRIRSDLAEGADRLPPHLRVFAWILDPLDECLHGVRPADDRHGPDDRLARVRGLGPLGQSLGEPGERRAGLDAELGKGSHGGRTDAGTPVLQRLDKRRKGLVGRHR
jgi:hypothetical protein